jgi:tetratricopeptide (TPR) repeat protein/CHAT domain-containing protein
MPQELNLHFKNPQQVIICLVQHPSVTVDFSIPLTAQDREAIRHYLEVYAAQYVMDIDDQEAERVSVQLSQWGKMLFDAVFNNALAKKLFSQFINTPSDKYLVTITAQNPEILSLPWELLHDAGKFLFAFQPSITILRRIPPKTTFPAYASQSQLHILFIISRPQGAGFIDPRTDAQAVLKAIENYPAITVEFLQPATFENLWQRLQNPDLPQVDVIHFDGHGYFDKTGELEETIVKQLNSLSDDLFDSLETLDFGKNTGYLLFEKAGEYGKDGRHEFLVPTSWLTHILSESKIRLMVLSACQSAMVAHDDEETDEEPIGSIAVGLVANSVPSVLAMSYSVMVRATELLFGGFYQEIAVGKSVGMALDKARQALLQDTKRRDLQRGQERVVIKVSDWFLPTLYQACEDTPLVLKMTQESPKPHPHNLSALPDAGFWGRRRELWQIENWFVDGVRRVVVSGFSGQGKTFLAQELGRWLLQTARFDAVVFVDYSGYQGLDAVQWAVTTLDSVVEQNLVDVAAANAVLQNQRILLILDNLEVYVTDKQDILQELLTEAHHWSLLGETRVLITTRPVELGHEAYQVGDKKFRQLKLEGLGKEDALHYFEQLLVLSDNPVRLQTDELLRWFAKVQFHPLSIGLLARSLETEDLANLESRLNQLMLELPDNPVEATLQLVIEQLDEESRRLLPRLGVFQGGALLVNLVSTTHSEEQWIKFLPALVLTGLIQSEKVTKNFTFFKFHPILVPILWSHLDSKRQQALCQSHQQQYYEFSLYLWDKNRKSPIESSAIFKCELNNFLFAVKGALTRTTDYAVDFADNVNEFLNYFGLQRDYKALNNQLAKLARKVGSKEWYLTEFNLGKQLYSVGRYAKAATIFEGVLSGLDSTVSYERCIALSYFGRCFRFQGQAQQAITYYQQGLDLIPQLEQTKGVQRQTGLLYTDLADALTDMGRYVEAKSAYEQSLAIKNGEQRGKAVVFGQLGTLALLQGELSDARQRYQAALDLFHKLKEPISEATIWHQLGMVYQTEEQWENAEHAYRQAANIEETQGYLQGATQTWGQLASMMEGMGKWKEAETWYRKAIEVGQQLGDMLGVSKRLNNLANLLKNQSDCLTEAQKRADQSLAIIQNLDPATAKIWKTYHVLAQIADKQGNAEKAKKYRRLARETYTNFHGMRYDLRQYVPLILGIVAVVINGKACKEELEPVLKMLKMVNQDTVNAIIHILKDERDVDKLCEPLTYREAPIITAILEGIAQPESLEWFEQDFTD